MLIEVHVYAMLPVTRAKTENSIFRGRDDSRADAVRISLISSTPCSSSDSEDNLLYAVQTSNDYLLLKIGLVKVDRVDALWLD